MTMVRGWCPTAWMPMAAGDGLLLRVRPPLQRLSPAQMRLIGALATTFGNGAIDLTNRAALQLRGLDEPGCTAARDALLAAGLIDPDPRRERIALLLAPDWQAGDDTNRIAIELRNCLDELPSLPGKIGIAIDAGTGSVLTDCPADFRMERGDDGGLLLRADGRPNGAAIAFGQETDALIALARWFVASGGPAAGRMARHTAALPDWAVGSARPTGRPIPDIGPHPLGTAIALPFGRIDGAVLNDWASLPGLTGARLTPWRTLILEGVAIDDAPSCVDPSLRTVDACVGAPACPQASVETRFLALRLAPLVTGRLHVSGCAKGCARTRPADVTLTGRDGAFDLALGARAGDPPIATGLTPDAIVAHFERAPCAASL